MLSYNQQDLSALHRYWQAANYLSLAQLYLKENPLLKEPLQAKHLKPRPMGHWGTCPGLNLLYVHLNRLIKNTGSRTLFVCGPGHGAAALMANAWLEGTLTELYPALTPDLAGLTRFVRQFSTPGGIPNHASAYTPGSMHEGGELGYSLAHAFGAAFDNPDLLVACVVGDGEAETGPLEGSWKSIRFLNPKTDGAVLPILHLNGYKIASPALLARIPDELLVKRFISEGYMPLMVAGSDPEKVHAELAIALDTAWQQIRMIQHIVRNGVAEATPPWPMIILRTPKGWTCPEEADGKPLEGTVRSHQLPLTEVHENAAQLQLLEQWLRSYHPEELFDHNGLLVPALQAMAPSATLRMSSNSIVNTISAFKPLVLPDYKDYAVAVESPGQTEASATMQLGQMLRDILTLNKDERHFRIFSPDELSSNKLDAVFEATERTFTEQQLTTDEELSPVGRVMEVLNEHLCQGWLEGYLLTGRHGLFPTYEAFVPIIDSMFSQYAKWLKMAGEVPWRGKPASLNYLLTSHTWRQDHNGYSHQGPGFIDTVINKKSELMQVYFPPDANSLLAVMNHCFQERNGANLVVVSKQPALQWMDIQTATAHFKNGAGNWPWAGNSNEGQPDIVLACAGDVPTLETVAAAQILRDLLPAVKVRVVNIVTLLSLVTPDRHAAGLSEHDFDDLFTADKPVIFAYHGYVRLIHDLLHGRPGPERFHARGYMEEGTTTTPFDITVLNRMSRYHLAIAAIDHLPKKTIEAEAILKQLEDKLATHAAYIREHLEDMPEITAWKLNLK